MPVRRITNGGRKVIGKFPSIKNNRMVWWESQIERDYLYLIEMDPDVISYKEQPLKIRYSLDGKLHLYTPDFMVDRKNKRQIVEVKDEETSKGEECKRLFERIGPICRREGYEFAVVTERTIRVQPRLDNIKFIYKYAKAKMTSEYQIMLYSLFSVRESLSIEELIQGFASRGVSSNIVYALIHRGVLAVDLLEPIKPGSAAHLTTAFPKSRRKIA